MREIGKWKLPWKREIVEWKLLLSTYLKLLKHNLTAVEVLSWSHNPIQTVFSLKS